MLFHHDPRPLPVAMAASWALIPKLSSFFLLVFIFFQRIHISLPDMTPDPLVQKFEYVPDLG